jgi:competence protein ComEC
MRYLLFFIIVVYFFSYYFVKPVPRAEIIFFNVGQGDSFALKTTTGKIIVVDGGPSWNSLNGLGHWLGFGRNHISMIILSHDHEDHLTALPEILERYKVGQLIIPTGLSSQGSIALLKAAKNNNVAIEQLNKNRCYSLEQDCELCLFPPDQNFVGSKDKNDLSLALYFKCDGLSLVAAGDASKKREESLLLNNFNWQAQILKISHHGSASASADSFIKAVSPYLVFISVGANNPFNHPADSTLMKLKKLSLKIWRSDKLGSLIIYANNKQIYFKNGP